MTAQPGQGAPAPLVLVYMLREDMRNVPQYALPPLYALRPYREGDRATWLDIQRRSEPYVPIIDDHFDRVFGPDLAAMPKRCRFLVSPDGQDIGTITAWYDYAYGGRRWGRIHWVAIVPEFRGKGLAKPTMTEAMELLRRFGHRRAMLATQTVRTVAIKTYLDFGFVPDLSPAGAREAWESVRRMLRHTLLEQALR